MWEACANPDTVGRVVPLGDRRAELVQIGQRPSIRVWDEQPHVLEAVREELGDSILEIVEAFARARGDQKRARIRMLDATPRQRIEAIDLVEDELDGDVVGPDVGE